MSIRSIVGAAGAALLGATALATGLVGAGVTTGTPAHANAHTPVVRHADATARTATRPDAFTIRGISNCLYVIPELFTDDPDNETEVHDACHSATTIPFDEKGK